MDYPLRPTFGGYTLSVFVILHVGERKTKKKKTFKGEDWVKGYNKQADRAFERSISLSHNSFSLTFSASV